jgi:hypothetical protein
LYGLLFQHRDCSLKVGNLSFQRYQLSPRLNQRLLQWDNVLSNLLACKTNNLLTQNPSNIRHATLQKQSWLLRSKATTIDPTS